MPPEPANPGSTHGPIPTAWHSEPADAVAQALGCNTHTGLTREEVLAVRSGGGGAQVGRERRRTVVAHHLPT